MGGGMDQTISCVATKNKAAYITFNPLNAVPVTLPDDAVFVIANCLRMSMKAETASKFFNKRVVEGILAAKIVATKLGFQSTEINTLSDLHKAMRQKTSNNVTPEGMALIMEANLHGEPYSLDEIEACLGYKVTQQKCFPTRKAAADVLATQSRYLLRQRSTHVYTETARVLQFKAVCDEGKGDTVAELGRLMNASQDSCDVLYDCSCEELNDVIEIARRSGSLGSRLTGAGWGGCCVSIVRKQQAAEFVAKLKNLYYTGERSQHVKTALFATAPGSGVAIFSVPDFVF